MFDYVKAHRPLPDGCEPFKMQSKDFECVMTTLEITPDGRLCDCGEDLNFHGIFNFYGFDDENRWHEYNAKFSDGQLVSIEVVTDTP